MKKMLSLLLAVLMVCSLGVAAFAADAPELPVTELTVTSAVFGEGAEAPTLYFNKVFVVAPESKLTPSSTCTAPAFMIFGDEPYTADSARQTAIDSGLANIAAAEGAVLVFVNPQGETWADTDIHVYTSLMSDMYSNSSTNNFINGIAEELNFFTGQTAQKIMGDVGHAYVYGEGAGADFAAKLVKSFAGSQTFPDGVTITFDRTATSITLFNPSVLPEASAKADVITSVINGPADTAEKLAALTSNGHVSASEVADGFDPLWIANNYKTISGAYRRQVGVLIQRHDWAELGITETVRTDMFSVTGMDGASADLPIHSVVYYAADLNVKDAANPVPLVLTFHGGGNTALFQAQASEWPLIGKENGFITVAVDNHTALTGAHIVQLVDALKADYSIDTSRIYGSGFSMGSVKSWELFDIPLFAGVAPMSGSFAAPAGEAGNHIMPAFYVGGEASPLAELCHQGPDIINRVTYLMKANKINDSYEYNADVNLFWGVNGDIVYKVTDSKIFTDSTLTVNLFKSEDGCYYTALASSGNMSHEVYGRNSWAAWDFLKQFSRNADGSIAIDAVSYTLASDDGAIVGNSYNVPSVTPPPTGDNGAVLFLSLTAVLALAGLAAICSKKRAF